MSEYLRVLVVHRQKSVASEVKHLFDNAGWSVHLAHNGLDGLLAARREEYQIIVTSIDLPVITGIEMIRAVRNFSLNVSTPAFVIDANEDKNYQDILQKLNARIHSAAEDGIREIIDSYDRYSTLS